jgi:type III pantothenate kinase
MSASALPEAMIFHSFLLVDIGNTRVKWESSPICGDEPPRTGEMATEDATPERIREMREEFPGHFLVFASVVPDLAFYFRHTFKQGFHSVAADSPALGLEFDYPKPSEIGADRLAAAVAAHETEKWPVIIVSCGTATAFSVLDEKGRFCGGAIAPGLQTQLKALIGATAQLPEVSLELPLSPLGKSTEEAIRSGLTLGFQGGIKEIICQLSRALGSQHSPEIILTGGNAYHVTDALDFPHTLRPLLVFEGLRIIGNRVRR